MPHRFIPPENRKPRFPFKSNPKHRNSWSPGTHIIITEDEVIEVRIPKEDDKNKDEGKEKESKAASKDPQQLWNLYGPQRSADSIQINRQQLGPPQPGGQQQQQQPGGQPQHGGQQQQQPRWRSNSLSSGSQKGLRRQASGSSEALHSPEPPSFQHKRHLHQHRQPYGSGAEGNPAKLPERPGHHGPVVTPPRMRRQFSAPNLKAGRETTV